MVSREPQIFFGASYARPANSSAPAGVKVTKVRIRACQPRSIASLRPAVLGRAAAVLEQKRLVVLLDMNAASHRLDSVGDFGDSARGLLWIGKGARGSVFHQVPILAGA